MEWEDVSIEERKAFLEKTKTTPRVVFYSAIVGRLLSRLRERDGIRVFNAGNRSTVSKRIARVVYFGRLEAFTSHELGRHGFYTEMIVRNKVDPKTAARLGGSKSVRLVMETYVSPDEDRHIIDEVFGNKHGT